LFTPLFTPARFLAPFRREIFNKQLRHKRKRNSPPNSISWPETFRPENGHSYPVGLFGVAGVGPRPWPVRVVRHRRRLATRGKKVKMTTTRTHFTFRVDTWTPDGDSVVEHDVP
jgi:hypothetical protein